MVVKKGQVMIYGFMLALTVIILALAFAYPVYESAQNARNKSYSDTEFQGLDCSNSSISYYDKAACITTDLTPFYFVGALIFIGGIILVSKIVFS